MKIPRMSMITLGVADLDRATAFYEQVLATPPNKSHDGVRFIDAFVEDLDLGEAGFLRTRPKATG